MLHVCALDCKKAPTGVEDASCLTTQLTRNLTFGAALCSSLMQSCARDRSWTLVLRSL